MSASLSTLARPLALLAPDGTFAGYASLFNVPDLARDVVLPGAFRESLRTRGAAGIRMLFQHDVGEPVGVWTELTEDARGLYARGRLATEVTRAREILSLLRARALDGLSIGFRAAAARRDARTGIRRLAKIDLWEISIVTFPLLPGARIAEVKADPPDRAGARIAAAATAAYRSCPCPDHPPHRSLRRLRRAGSSGRARG